MVSNITSGTNCSICQDSLEEGSVARLNCRHEFHISCIDTWIGVCRRNSRDPTCPLDREGIRTIDDEPLENSNAALGRREIMIYGLSLHIVPILNLRNYNQRMQEIFNELSRNIDSMSRLDMGHNQRHQRLQQTLDALRSSFALPRYPDE